MSDVKTYLYIFFPPHVFWRQSFPIKLILTTFKAFEHSSGISHSLGNPWVFRFIMEIPKTKAGSGFGSVIYLSFPNVEPEGYAQIQYFILQLSSGELFKLQNVKYAMITIIQTPVILSLFFFFCLNGNIAEGARLVMNRERQSILACRF